MLILQPPRVSQPQDIALVDAPHPLAQGLAAFVYPQAHASYSAVDGRHGASAGSTAIARRNYPAGRALAWNTALSSQFIDTPCPSAPRVYTGSGFTVYARFMLLGETAGSTPGSFSGSNPIFGLDFTGAGTNGAGISVGAGLTNIAAGINLGANRNTPDLALTIGVTYNAFLRCTTGQNAVLTVIGVSTTVSTAATGIVNLSVTPTAAAKAVIGCRSATSGPGSAALFVGAFWWRNITDAEMRRVADNPWQLIRRRSLYIPVGAAGGAPAVCLLNDGSLAYKSAASGTDKKVYWTTGSRLEAKLTAGVGDKILTMTGGQLKAT